MKTILACLLLSLSACGQMGPASCAQPPRLEYALARCGFSIAKTDAGYIMNYFYDGSTQCTNTQVMVDGDYRDATGSCFFTVSNNGADISLERNTK
jgi:hypothetical protein